MSTEDLAVDMYETMDEVVVKAALPGVKPEQLDINIAGDVLNIRGESNEETNDEQQDYIRRERRYGSFSRSVTLPSGLQADKADAKFENGMLTLKIPKSEQMKPRTIKVKAA
jgi:HSP20 family protein